MLSFAVTTFNETAPERHGGQNVLNCLRAAEEHPAVSEIVVVDDGSTDYPALLAAINGAHIAKSRVFHHADNRGVFINKLESVALCKNDWVITCDSDNRKDAVHIDKALTLPLDPDVWYLPSFARPTFDYRGLIGEYDLRTIGNLKGRPMMECCLNTGNQIVHRRTFMDVFGQYRNTRYWLDMWRHLDVPEKERDTKYWRQVWDANDSLLYNMLWLYAGKRLAVVDGLEYDHYWTGGDESNYIRSPQEKEALNGFLLNELMKRSAGVC